jgi:homoserine O-succinyltransferase
MPVHLVDASSNDFAARRETSAAGEIHIGLVNNMPDGALKSTERQFLALLDAAAQNVIVHLWLFALPYVPRAESGLTHISRFYSGIENLWDSRLDGLIVTGTEPRAPQLTAEPYWESLTKVLEWAEHNTQSSVWSCLAAHAAVLHIDGIGRRRLPEKRCGVFDCARVSEYALTKNLPAALRVPHSRWNDLAENDLVDAGYSILTRATDGVVDAFVKRRKSLFVFFQGHPEYEANTLLLEYRRDVGRYLRGEVDTYPLVPQGYFESDSIEMLAEFRARAMAHRDKDLLTEFPAEPLEARLLNTWRPLATQLYGNWLAYLGAQKKRRTQETQPRLSVSNEPAFSVNERTTPRAAILKK